MHTATQFFGTIMGDSTEPPKDEDYDWEPDEDEYPNIFNDHSNLKGD